MSPKLSRVDRLLPLPLSKMPSCTTHWASVTVSLTRCTHFERSLPSNSTMASAGGAPGASPGVTTGGCGRLSS